MADTRRRPGPQERARTKTFMDQGMTREEASKAARELTVPHPSRARSTNPVPGPAPTPSQTPVETLEPDRPVLHRLVDLVRGRKPEPNVAAAFDGSATLNLDDEPSLAWPRNPVPAGEPSRRQQGKTKDSSKPAAADELTPLFAMGFVLLTGFAIGEWAQPTADEANAIAAPMANIFARRIDLAAKLGKDASDTVALAVALMAYTYRVGPIAVERIRESIDERRHRAERVYGPVGGGGPSEPSYDTGQGGMAAGSANGANAQTGSANDSFASLAKARDLGRRVLDRDLGGVSGRDTSMGPDGGPF